MTVHELAVSIVDPRRISEDRPEAPWSRRVVRKHQRYVRDAEEKIREYLSHYWMSKEIMPLPLPDGPGLHFEFTAPVEGSPLSFLEPDDPDADLEDK